MIAKKGFSVALAAIMTLALSPIGALAETSDGSADGRGGATSEAAAASAAESVQIPSSTNSTMAPDEYTLDAAKEALSEAQQAPSYGTIGDGQVVYPAELEDAVAAATSTANDETAYQAASSAAYHTESTVNPYDYTYSIQPIIAPFNNIIYVKTDNPDPNSFRIYDKSTKYRTSSTSSYADGGFVLLDAQYMDVVYEDASTYRVNGGYIFYDYFTMSDGGTLTVQKKGSHIGGGEYQWDDVATVSCPALEDRYDYLIDNYTSSSNGFFDNLDAVQSALGNFDNPDGLALYPKLLLDESQPSSEPYPCLCTSPYPELSLNEHYETMFEHDSLFCEAIYPFVLSSSSFPGTMRKVATRLNSSCTITAGYTHPYIDVTLNGETHTYGGAGYEGTEATYPIYSSKVIKNFKFDGSSSDMGLNGTLTSIGDQYEKEFIDSEELVKPYKDIIAGKTFSEKIGTGSWIRVSREGSGGLDYAYIACGTTEAYETDENGNRTDLGYTYTRTASDAWVDGRYIDEYESAVPGTSWSEHPEADIILHNITYTDKYGDSHTGDVVYNYDSSTDTWRAPRYYTRANWWDSGMTLPDALVLTRAQVNAMVSSGQMDGNVDHIPESGLVYDGYEPCGTPFTSVLATGITLTPSSLTMPKNSWDSSTFKAQVYPTNATCANSIAWSSSDEDIAKVYADSNGKCTIYSGSKEGTCTITALSMDGQYTATATVTVTGTGINGATVSYQSSQQYTGYAITPAVTVTLNNTTLTQGTDYTVSYSNNVEPGTGTITITGIGDYAGTITKQFTITKGNLWYANFRWNYYQEYTGRQIQPPVTVTLNGTTLTQGTDYAVSYSNNVEPGYGQVNITGINGYTGATSCVFKISGAWYRLSGDTRFGTMSAIVSQGFDQADTVVVASGENFPDALSASALAGVYNAPIVLAARDYLPTEAANLLSKYHPSKVIFIGGEASISSAVEKEACDHAGVDYKAGTSYSDQRIFGEDRIETSLAIMDEVEAVTGQQPSSVIVASGMGFADSLAISPYAYKTSTPIMLVGGNGALTDDQLSRIPSSCDVIIVGGPVSVPNYVQDVQLGGKANRLYGDTRYDTARAIINFELESGMTVTGAAVASGVNFPDALAGSAFCGKNNSVLALVTDDYFSAMDPLVSNRSSIKRGWLLGGYAAIDGYSTWWIGYNTDMNTH